MQVLYQDIFLQQQRASKEKSSPTPNEGGESRSILSAIHALCLRLKDDTSIQVYLWITRIHSLSRHCTLNAHFLRRTDGTGPRVVTFSVFLNWGCVSIRNFCCFLVRGEVLSQKTPAAANVRAVGEPSKARRGDESSTRRA